MSQWSTTPPLMWSRPHWAIDWCHYDLLGSPTSWSCWIACWMNKTMSTNRLWSTHTRSKKLRYFQFRLRSQNFHGLKMIQLKPGGTGAKDYESVIGRLGPISSISLPFNGPKCKRGTPKSERTDRESALYRTPCIQRDGPAAATLSARWWSTVVLYLTLIHRLCSWLKPWKSFRMAPPLFHSK